mmetsp:Transcript_2704/g.6847  ORF Transcript_2704/g.6847 Transcript_2704/m.6847 type:complete len:208 (-) Transcript_2704:184-807(-)
MLPPVQPHPPDLVAGRPHAHGQLKVGPDAARARLALRLVHAAHRQEGGAARGKGRVLGVHGKQELDLGQGVHEQLVPVVVRVVAQQVELEGLEAHHPQRRPVLKLGDHGPQPRAVGRHRLVVLHQYDVLAARQVSQPVVRARLVQVGTEHGHYRAGRVVRQLRPGGRILRVVHVHHQLDREHLLARAHRAVHQAGDVAWPPEVLQQE